MSDKNISTAKYFFDLHNAKTTDFWSIDVIDQSDVMYQMIYENLMAGKYGYVTLKYHKNYKAYFTIIIRRRNSITRMPLTFEWFEVLDDLKRLIE